MPFERWKTNLAPQSQLLSSVFFGAVINAAESCEHELRDLASTSDNDFIDSDETIQSSFLVASENGLLISSGSQTDYGPWRCTVPGTVYGVGFPS